MRRSFNDVALIYQDDGDVLAGINLGWDFTAEHERGIDDIKGPFGIGNPSRKIFGLNARAVSKVPDGLELIRDEKRGFTYLLFLNGRRSGVERISKNIDDWMEINHGLGNEIEAAWAGRGAGDFSIRVKSAEAGAHLEDVYDSIRRKDAVMFLGGAGKPFSNPGFVIAIRSRIPKELEETLAHRDLDRLNLIESAEKTGIAERLKNAGRRYYALRPEWASSMGSSKPETVHEVVFWLTPRNQEENRSGWFTVEDLDAWIDGRGSIPMRKKSQT